MNWKLYNKYSKDKPMSGTGILAGTVILLIIAIGIRLVVG